MNVRKSNGIAKNSKIIQGCVMEWKLFHNIRKNYHLEKIPRGKQRGKFFFGSKIAALNFRKLFNYVKGLGHYAQNPVLV